MSLSIKKLTELILAEIITNFTKIFRTFGISRNSTGDTLEIWGKQGNEEVRLGKFSFSELFIGQNKNLRITTGYVYLLDNNGNELIKAAHNGAIEALKGLITISNDGVAKINQPVTGPTGANGLNPANEMVLYNKDGKKVFAIGSDGLPKIYDGKTGKEIMKVNSTGNLVVSQNSPATEALMIMAKDSSNRVVNVPISAFSHNQPTIPDEKTLVWNIDEEQAMRVSNDGTYDKIIVTGGDDGFVGKLILEDSEANEGYSILITLDQNKNSHIQIVALPNEMATGASIDFGYFNSGTTLLAHTSNYGYPWEVRDITPTSPVITSDKATVQYLDTESNTIQIVAYMNNGTPIYQAAEGVVRPAKSGDSWGQLIGDINYELNGIYQVVGTENVFINGVETAVALEFIKLNDWNGINRIIVERDGVYYGDYARINGDVKGHLSGKQHFVNQYNYTDANLRKKAAFIEDVEYVDIVSDFDNWTEEERNNEYTGRIIANVQGLLVQPEDSMAQKDFEVGDKILLTDYGGAFSETGIYKIIQIDDEEDNRITAILEFVDDPVNCFIVIGNTSADEEWSFAGLYYWYGRRNDRNRYERLDASPEIQRLQAENNELRNRQNNYAAPLLNPADRSKFLPAASELIDGVWHILVPNQQPDIPAVINADTVFDGIDENSTSVSFEFSVPMSDQISNVTFFKVGSTTQTPIIGEWNEDKTILTVNFPTAGENILEVDNTYQFNLSSLRSSDGIGVAHYDVIQTFELKQSGVLINGQIWATCNVGAPGTFALTPESSGMVYQWGKNVGWSPIDPMINSNGETTWDSVAYSSNTWVDDPSPNGWRLPTRTEANTLFDTSKVSREFTNQNGVDGFLFTDLSNGNSIFLPKVNGRNNTYLQTAPNYYHTSTVYYPLYFLYQGGTLTALTTYYNSKIAALSIRPIKI